MVRDSRVRASDADRDRVAASLREHCAQGRITLDEVDERLEDVYSARTLADLERLTADLPEEDMYELPVPARQRAGPAAAQGSTGLYRRGAYVVTATYVSVNLICFTVWLLVALTSGVWYPWWVWVAGPWGAVMLAGWLFGPRRDGRT